VKDRNTVLLTSSLMGTIKMKPLVTQNCRAFSQEVGTTHSAHSGKAIRICKSASELHISALKLKLSTRILANVFQ
jgi:hypothetical protein